MRITLILCLAVAAALVMFFAVDLSNLMSWAIEAQHGFQNKMASAVRAIKSGDPAAYFALLSATAAYGFVHALGPGHGKYLVGGVGFGTTISVYRLLSLAVASSLAQAIWAIVLVYGGFALIQVTAGQVTNLTENFLAPASYIAIGGIGLVLVWRGLRKLRTVFHHDHHHDHSECGCHSHGPTPEEAARVGSLREAIALIASIAVRPCTGAIFLLVIAWQMDIKIAGAAAVIVMGLGTATLTGLVAVSSSAARRLAFENTGSLGNLQVAFPALQVFVGTMIFLSSLALLRFVS